MIVAIYAALIFLLMMAVPRDSEAECAWVLWSQELVVTQTDFRKEWSPRGGWTDETMCQRAKEDAIRRGLSHPVIPGGKVGRDGDTLRVLLPGGSRLASVYRCLPDTIDPRGPTGGAR